MTELLQKIKECLEIAFCYSLAGLTALSFIVLICFALYLKDKEKIKNENNKSEG